MGYDEILLLLPQPARLPIQLFAAFPTAGLSGSIVDVPHYCKISMRVRILLLNIRHQRGKLGDPREEIDTGTDYAKRSVSFRNKSV
jgi:hypothetical protein